MRMISTLKLSSYQNKVYILALILGLFIFVLPSCTEEVAPSQSIEIKKAGFEKFSIEDLPAMANAIAPFVNPNFEQKVDGKLTVSPQNESELSKALNYDEVIARYDGKGNTNYAMAVADNDDNPFSFSNFIIMKDSTGAFRTPFVLTYEMADDFIEEYLVDQDISKFRGKIIQYDLGPMDAQRVDSRNPGTNDPEPGSGGSTGTSPTQDGNVICEKQYAGSGGAPPPSGSWGNFLICEFFINVVYDYSTDGSKNVRYTYITQENCTLMWIAQQDAAGTTTCPSGTGDGEIPLIELDIIIDYLLSPCLKNLMPDIKNLSTGMSHMIKELNGIKPGYSNWVMKDGVLAQGTGETSSVYNKTNNSVTSTFNTLSYPNASDLSWARTILHESVHAYFVAYYSKNRAAFLGTYSQMVQDWNVYQNWNSVHHEEFARSLVNKIADALQEYGIKNGYNLSKQFYQDMSWAGLDGTTAFQSLTALEKKRILDVIAIELTGKDTNGIPKNKNGNNAGC